MRAYFTCLFGGEVLSSTPCSDQLIPTSNFLSRLLERRHHAGGRSRSLQTAAYPCFIRFNTYLLRDYFGVVILRSVGYFQRRNSENSNNLPGCYIIHIFFLNLLKINYKHISTAFVPDIYIHCFIIIIIQYCHKPLLTQLTQYT